MSNIKGQIRQEIERDEILVYPVFRDPMEDSRIYDSFDGSFHKRLEDGLWIDVEEQK